MAGDAEYVGLNQRSIPHIQPIQYTPPVSLHNTYITRVISLSVHNNFTDHYTRLPINRDAVEKSSPRKIQLLKTDNWERLLIPKVSRVYVPISTIGTHHHIIETYGHDRKIELLYTGTNQLGTHDAQLNFILITDEGILPAYKKLACRASGLDTYIHKMYVKLTDEQSERYSLRMNLIEWRDAVQKRRHELTKICIERLKEEELLELTKVQEEYIYALSKKCIYPRIATLEMDDDSD